MATIKAASIQKTTWTVPVGPKTGSRKQTAPGSYIGWLIIWYVILYVSRLVYIFWYMHCIVCIYLKRKRYRLRVGGCTIGYPDPDWCSHETMKNLAAKWGWLLSFPKDGGLMPPSELFDSRNTTWVCSVLIKLTEMESQYWMEQNIKEWKQGKHQETTEAKKNASSKIQASSGQYEPMTPLFFKLAGSKLVDILSNINKVIFI